MQFHTRLFAWLLVLPLIVIFATSADALSKRGKKTVKGGAIGAGVGALIDGKDGAKKGAAIGAIAGNLKGLKDDTGR